MKIVNKLFIKNRNFFCISPINKYLKTQLIHNII